MKELLKRLVFVHKCVGCGTILIEGDFDKAFCKDCIEKYLSSKMSICPECAEEVKACGCMPKFMKKDGVPSFRKLFFYDKNKRSEPQNRLVYFLKGNRSTRVAREVAKELSELLFEELIKFEIPRSEAIITFVPRSRSAVAMYGFDQSEVVGRELSKICEIEFSAALKRKRGGKPQKSLTAGERRKNIQKLLYANPKTADALRGKTVILVDDVVTTGASMSACVHILKEQGAKRILCLALSSDIKT